MPVLHTSADARAGGGASFGSRGSRSFSLPSATATAPRSAQPFSRPYGGPGAEQPRRFGFGSGLLAGLLGASLLGGGMMGGGFGGLLGLLFNIALIGGLIWLVLRVVRGFSARPAMAGAGASRTASSPLPGATAAPVEAASLGPDDYAAFETSLQAIQDAYSREDIAAIAGLTTVDVARQLEGELDANRRRGLRNEVSGIRLLSGDLSEAWQEGPATFATVAMRFGAVDVMRDRTTGRVVSGDASQPVEATELWTFTRSGRNPWRLSAIQQAA